MPIINNFTPGAGTKDVIDLRASGFENFAAVQAITADNLAGNAVIDLGGDDSITLIGVNASTLDADDLLL